MLQPIQSAVYPDYFRFSEAALGLQTAKWRVSAKRAWGKHQTIEFLISLGEWWNLSHRTDSPPPILIGDISPEGGAHPKRDPVKDHSSHKTGSDFDIFVFRKDGKPERTSILKKDEYDIERTTKLVKLIFDVAKFKKVTIDKFYFNDITVQKVSPAITTWVNHEDHCHIRLKSK